MNPRTSLIVAVVALLVGGAGVFIGIQAKNDSSDAQDSSDAVKAQVDAQLGSAESQIEKGANVTAKTVAGEISAIDKQIATLSASVKTLEGEVATLTANSNKQSGDIQALTQEISKIQSQIAKLQANQ